MTSEEKQEIINAVLAALRTNSKSIDQLTPVSEMSDTDFLELNGGRKVSYGVLFANHMSSDEAQEAWEYLDANKVDKDLRGLVEVHQATVVYLDAMGNLDGHTLSGSEGLEYRTDTKLIYDFPGGKLGAPKQGAVYISKNNFKKFVWNGTDLEELKADECPLFVDYSEPVAFATLPVGGSYYVPSSHKIAVKIDASSTKTYDPLPDALYFFRDKGMIYTWKSSTNKWVPAGSDIKVVNNLTAGGEADALSAEQGKVLKGLIDNIGTGSIAAFAQYAVFESVSALPATGVSTTGYIVDNHIYAYVGTGGDTRDGKYQDLGALEAAGVSVTTAEDGTFTIHAGGNDYTVNLNHTHENMAKLIVCEESDLPSTLAKDTIYAQVNDADNPTEIEVLYIAGIEFAGGGVPAGTPAITKPSGATLNLGENSGSGVSKTIEIKGRDLTGDLTVTVGTGLTISYGQTLDGSSVTIPLANALAGAMVTISYSGSGALDDGSLVISGGGASPKSVVVVVVVAAPVDLAAIKLTGSQWLKTDYFANANTELELECQFATNSHSYASDQTGVGKHFLRAANNTSPSVYFYFMISTSTTTTTTTIEAMVEGDANNQVLNISASEFFVDHSIFRYEVGPSNNYIKFQTGGSGTVRSSNIVKKQSQMTSPLNIGLNTYNNTIFSYFDLTIYRLTIKENGVAVRNYVPKSYMGVPGLYDTVTGAFISSETDSEVVAIPLTE